MKRSIALGCLVATVVAGLVLVVCAQDRVLLKDVTSLTFRAGAMTTARRSSPIPQLQCTGRFCSKNQLPQAVQCVQTGWDGRDANWRCEASPSLPSNLKIGRTVVSCEGYNYPDDPYILVGSCGLKYQLVDATNRGDDTEEGSWVIGALFFLIFALIVGVIIMKKCCRRRQTTRDDDGEMPPPPPYDDYYRMPSARRPSSSSACRTEPAPSAPASSGPGFFTGLGLGGLAGYAFGNRSSATSAHRYPRSSGHSDWIWGSSSSSPDPAPSHSSGTSTFFATTERR